MSTTIDQFDIFEWIQSGTVAQRTVVIYNDPAVAVEFEALERRLQAVEPLVEGADREMGAPNEAAQIEAEMAALYDRWQASKAVWTVQALPEEKIREVAEAHPTPQQPPTPPPGADEATKAAHRAAVEEWAPKFQEARQMLDLALLSAAVVKVETPRGTASSVPLEALIAMRARPHGPAQIRRLVEAFNEATRGDVEIPAPKSHGSSKGTQG